MDFDKLTTRFKQFGSYRLILEYARIGALLPGIKAFLWCLIKRQSFKQIYPEVLKRVEPFLIKRYSSEVSRFKFQVSNSQEHKRSKIIWFCWLQGIENAPEIVQACYNSIKRNIPGREIKLIDNENWEEYIELPDYIAEKWEKQKIPAALFSDLLRLELLIKYGGTWIDSTVLCTGLNNNYNENDNFLNADLFLFQYTNQGSIPVSISNWFITACTNNKELIMLRDMLYAYWKDYDCTLDYYIFHLFFSIISKECTEEILAMPYGQSMNSLVLARHWNEGFNQSKWDKLTENISFHKLGFRIDEKVKRNKDNYYNHILSKYGRF